jgi:phage baseplate assembly protein W
MSAFLGKDWAFPIKPDARGGLAWSEGAQSVSESIWTILSTLKRARIMVPDFGCGIHDYVFAPNNTATRARIESEVRAALTRWEPRIDVLRITPTSHADAPNTILIEIDYRLRTNNMALNLVYPFYVEEGGK